jgi:hypothetical protein
MSPSAWTRIRRRERQSRSPSPPLRLESPRSRDALSRPQPFSPNAWPLRRPGVGLALKHAIDPPTEHRQVPGARSESRRLVWDSPSRDKATLRFSSTAGPGAP